MSVELRNGINTRNALTSCALLFLIVLSGCVAAKGDDDYTSGDISGINHTSAAINYVKVNGYGGPNISPFGDGGGYCCVMLPTHWYAGLKAKIEWEVDPLTAPPPPSYKDWDKYQAWEKILKASYVQHSSIVDIPEYGAKRCGLTVHFLSCNQIKVTTVCDGYGTPNYPIKEPRHMKEPVSCPVN